MTPREEWVATFQATLKEQFGGRAWESNGSPLPNARTVVYSLRETADALAISVFATQKLPDGGEMIDTFRARLQNEPVAAAMEVVEWIDHHQRISGEETRELNLL